jgi:hypothetical protein
MLIHKAPLHKVTVSVTCAMHAARNIRTIFFLVCSVLQVELGSLGPYFAKNIVHMQVNILHTFPYHFYTLL